MVRSYKRKKVSHLDTNQLENLAKEYLSLKPSISLRQFAKSKGISYTTTYRWVKKLNTKMVPGHPTVLSAAEESLLTTALKFLGDSNMGQDREDIANMVQEFLKATKRPNPFKNGKPGKDWIISFQHSVTIWGSSGRTILNIVYPTKHARVTDCSYLINYNYKRDRKVH